MSTWDVLNKAIDRAEERERVANLAIYDDAKARHFKDVAGSLSAALVYIVKHHGPFRIPRAAMDECAGLGQLTTAYDPFTNETIVSVRDEWRADLSSPPPAEAKGE